MQINKKKLRPELDILQFTMHAVARGWIGQFSNHKKDLHTHFHAKG
jgi:hypothetical protein